MFVPRSLRTFGELVAFLADAAIPHEVDAARQIIEAGPVRIQWELEHPFLHVTMPLVTAVPAGRVAAIERAILERNHEAKVPLLDFDAATSTVALRITAMLLVDGIRVDLLQALLGGIENRAARLRTELARLVA